MQTEYRSLLGSTVRVIQSICRAHKVNVTYTAGLCIYTLNLRKETVLSRICLFPDNPFGRERGISRHSLFFLAVDRSLKNGVIFFRRDAIRFFPFSCTRGTHKTRDVRVDGINQVGAGPHRPR